jgi:hypothetical protein
MQAPPALPSAKPKTLSVFGVINLLFGAYCLVAAVPGVFMMLRPAQNADNPVIQVMQNDAVYAAFQKAMIVPGLLAVVALLAGAIGLLKGREWGRKLTIIWACFMIITTPLTTWMHIVHVQPTLMKQMAEKMSSEPNAEAVINGMQIGMTIGMAGVAVLMVIYGIVLIAMLTRPKIRAYCRARQAP